MESTLDIRVKQGRLFCAPALESQYGTLTLCISPAKLARPAVKNIAQVFFCVCACICFCPEYIPEIAQNNLND